MNADGASDGLDIQPFLNLLLNACAPPAITQQPVGPEQVCEGGQASFSVAATGTGLTYQWKKDGVNLADDGRVAGSTADYLQINSIQAGDAGAYEVVVGGQCGQPEESAAAVLIVNTSPLISAQPPLTQYVSIGQTAMFSVAASGLPSPTFQWRKAGINLSDDARISGSTTASLVINPVQEGDAGDYEVVVSNECGSLSSDTSALVVTNCTDSAWSQAFVSGPTALYGQSMVYDPIESSVMLFGGRRNTGAGEITTNQMWSWNGAMWQELAVTRPRSRDGHGMAFDSAQQKVVMFGGFCWKDSCPSGEFLNDLWEWDGAAWIDRTPVPPPPPGGSADWPSQRSGFGMAYDAAHQKVVVFGGGSSSSNLQDTWTWNGTSWTQVQEVAPPALSWRYLTAMAYDPVNEKIVLFGGLSGGGPKGDTWIWDGSSSTWSVGAPESPSGPSARYGHVMVYDTRIGQVVLFGGYNGSTYLNDIWYWDGVTSTWTEVTQPPQPNPRGRAAGAFDTVRNAFVLFGGQDALTISGETWEYRCGQ